MFIKGTATFQKLGVSIFPSSPHRLPTTTVTGVRGRGMGGGVPLPTRLGNLGASQALPAGPQTILGRFMCNFMHLLVHLTAAWKREISTPLYWLVGLIFPFNFFGVSDTSTWIFGGVRTPTTPMFITIVDYTTLLQAITCVGLSCVRTSLSHRIASRKVVTFVNKNN